jgi:uncharacterized protein
MIAVDAGCFIALADRRDRWHTSAVASLHTQREGWVTTWPVLAEACHVISRRLGVAVSAALMDDVGDGNLLVWSPSQAMLARIPVLLRQYADLPMDLADASLVLLAEHLGHGRILSTDQRDFGAYRWKNHEPFHNLLEDPP